MGLSIYYEWKTKCDLSTARRLIAKFRGMALKLPFDDVSEIYEQDPPGGQSEFEIYDHPFRQGDLYLSRKRADGESELVNVPARHALFFMVRVEGSESAAIGLASHPPVVLHHEEVREYNDKVCSSRSGVGSPIEYPTRRRGYYSWHSFCKTQYAGNPKLGGEANFLKAHLSLIELVDQIQAAGLQVRIRDDSKYAKHRDVDRLLNSLREWDAIVANIVGKFRDVLGNKAGRMIVAPINERPDFEHLEAKGIKVLKNLAARQRRRKRGS
jgi:hypothetical protein